jgi:hypothetical protein
VASIVDAVSRYVTDLTLIGPDELVPWLAALPVPAGWQIGRAENSPVQPTRTTVHRRDSLVGWDTCETINVFRFKGVCPHAIIRFNADCALRAGDAQDITIYPLQTPAEATMTAVRSSGYLTLANQQSIWAQYSTYVAGDDTHGLLVEHGIFAVADHQAHLHNDITELSNAVYDALSVPWRQDQSRTSTRPVTRAQAIFHPRKGQIWPPFVSVFFRILTAAMMWSS